METKFDIKSISQSVQTENYDILSSGCVIVPHNEYLEFTFENLHFRIIFQTEKDDKGNLTDGRFETHLNETSPNSYLEIVLYNQNQSYFSTAQNFISLAILRKRRLFLKFCITSINEQCKEQEKSEDKLFFYTWYLGKDIVDKK